MEVDYAAHVRKCHQWHATYATTYYDITLAVLYLGDRHYWEDMAMNLYLLLLTISPNG